MEKIRYFILMALCVIGITSCQDDLTTGTAGADVNKPVKVDLKFGIPKSMQVEVTRADNSYSGMYGVRLYVFSGNNFLGEPQQMLTDDGTLTVGSSSDQGQTYTAHNVTLYEGGKQMVYAIGNITRTGYWDSNVLNTIDAAAKEGLSKFKEVLYTLSSQTISRKTYPSFATAYMPLSGSGEVTVENNSASGVVTLKRIVSQIKFEITTSQEVNGKTVTFEPNNYAFHNIATHAYVLDGIEQEVLTTTTYDANPVNIAGAGDDGIAEFSVYLPENIQTAKKTGAGDYDDRESFSGQGEDKDWTYAPDNGTYVVISGVCTEKDGNGNMLRYGNVKYIIHMGDFGKNGSMNDFSVERNCIYTYKVSVHGMDKIEVEAKKESDDYQNGAEGDVIEMGTGAKIFNVDAHYEQVFVEYNLSDILTKVQERHPDPGAVSEYDLKADIADQFRLVIHTPLNTGADRVVLPYSPDGKGEEIDMAGIDYKWVEFYPQSQYEYISPYPGQGKTEEGKILYSPYQVCRMMGDAISQLYNNENSTPSVKGLILKQEGNGDWVARFTIFIDEYFYTKDLEGKNVAWDRFTRQDPRTMMIASDMEISDDLNSTYSQAQTYISQQAIQTFYNPDAADYYNALGIETYNETGIMDDFCPEQNGSSTIPSSTDQSKGRDNMLKNMGILPNRSNVTDDQWTSERWNAYIDFSQVGYTDDNSTGNNRWGGNWNTQQTAYAYYACMSRNRDLNGDGQIDPTEVRWYLPALSQYLRIGIGVKALPAETRLFTGDASTMTGNYPNDYIEQGSLYYTNTTIDANPDLAYSLYWAVEVGAYGAQNYSAMVRCVRNLPNLKIVNEATGDDDVRLVNRDAWARPVYDEVKYTSDGNILFDFGDRLVSDIFRNSESQQYGPYDPHDEQNEEIMKLPGGFVVAKEDLYIRNNNPSIPLGLYDGSDSYDRRGAGDNCDFDWKYNSWPYYMKDPCSSYSEKSGELGVWRTPNLNELMVMSTVDGLLRSSANTYSRTQFSHPKREIFYYNYNGFITTSANEDNSPGYIRCVRDATQAERELLNR